jgi:hypothetical protein
MVPRQPVEEDWKNIQALDSPEILKFVGSLNFGQPIG